MADPAPLQKCEELPARVHNPMWAFLKGIEGFDTERASECLGKLLDKHYDTIEVLKLTTKLDLVEDAGILPGDALRIVAAAKPYVAPQEADHSAGFGVSEPPPQSDAKDHGVVGDADHLQSVEHQQHFYRPPALRVSTPGAQLKTELFTPAVTSQARPRAHSPPVMPEQKKARTVAQESRKRKEQDAVYVAAPSVKVGNESAVPKHEAAKESKLVKLAAPKHIKDVTSPVKDSKVPKQSYPIPIGITYPHTCQICNIQCLSETTFHMHYNGRKHRAKSAKVLESVTKAMQPAQVPKAVAEAKQPVQVPKAATEMKKSAETQEEEKQPTQSAALHICGLCNVMYTLEVDLRSHFNSLIHIQNLEAATNSNDDSPTTFLHCSICDINSTCKRNLVMHFKGKKHAQKMKVESEPGMKHAQNMNVESESGYRIRILSELVREAPVVRESEVTAMAAECGLNSNSFL